MPQDPIPPRPDVRWGLCATCAHARVIESDRASAFVQCGLAKEDPRYRKYPYVPVDRCDGYFALQSAAFPPDLRR